MTESVTGKDCQQCGHPFDPHVMVATGETPTEGGIILCPESKCECFSTWSVPQLGGTRADVAMPPEQEIAQLRQLIRTRKATKEKKK